MSYTITVISDTHSRHNFLNGSLPGGDVLIHAGDLTNMGYLHEIKDFLEWFDGIRNYTYKIFIGGNHDFLLEENPNLFKEMLSSYKSLDYLEDSSLIIRQDHNTSFKVYGSPYQPEFNSWAFNLPREGDSLKNKWAEIPKGVDILVTHGPPKGILDKNQGGDECGCEHLLNEVTNRVKPSIHIFGHIHEGYGYLEKNGTHFINASFLNVDYRSQNEPITFEWEVETNVVKFI